VKDLLCLLKKPSAAKVYENRAIKSRTSADTIKEVDDIQQLINEEMEFRNKQRKKQKKLLI
jgi:hypothetical protein